MKTHVQGMAAGHMEQSQASVKILILNSAAGSTGGAASKKFSPTAGLLSRKNICV